MQDEVIILGGGIAGISAALALADAGRRVTLIESRNRLGGRASSFQDARSGEWLDNCQHVTLGCCTNYLALCRRLGVEQFIRWDHEQHWVEEGGRTSVIRSWPLPAPAHGAVSFLKASFLTPAEKLAIAGALCEILRADRSLHEHEAFGTYLASLSQPVGTKVAAGAVRKFWEPVIVSACNLPTSRASAAAALQVFQEGFLASAEASKIGIMTIPLSRVYDAAEPMIRDAGGRVLLETTVEEFDEHRVRLARGGDLSSEVVVCALPFEKAVQYASPELRERDARFERLRRMTHSPILGVHLWFDRPVLATPHAVLVDRGTQWLFRKDEQGCRIHAVISAADAWMGLEPAQITEQVLADIHACLPDSRGAVCVSSRPVKERRATFACTPSFESLRPRASVGGQGPFLAGDYTLTGWPATMEGAARSGRIAAAEVLGKSAAALLEPALPMGVLPQLLMP